MSVKALKSLQGNCLSVPLGIWCWTGLVWGFASLSLQQKQKTKLFPEQTVVWLSVSLMILTQQTWQLCPAPVATLQNWHTWYMREGLRSHQMAWVRMCSFLRGAAWLGWGRFLLLSACLFWPEMCENSCYRWGLTDEVSEWQCPWPSESELRTGECALIPVTHWASFQTWATKEDRAAHSSQVSAHLQEAQGPVRDEDALQTLRGGFPSATPETFR